MVVQVAGLLSHHGHLLLGKGLESLQAVGFMSAQTENSQERAGTLCCLDRASHASKGARYQLLLFMRETSKGQKLRQEGSLHGCLIRSRLSQQVFNHRQGISAVLDTGSAPRTHQAVPKALLPL